MLSNADFLAKFRFDTAENEPAKNLQNFANFANPTPLRPNRKHLQPGAAAVGPGPGGVQRGAARVERRAARVGRRVVAARLCSSFFRVVLSFSQQFFKKTS